MACNNDKPEQIKETIKQNSTLIEDGPPPVYALNLKEVVRNEVHQVHKMEFGDGNNDINRQTTDKVIMVVGATGAGKSTFINGLINYVVGVKWEDPYRFKLVHETTHTTQASSQTSSITSYTIHHQKGFQVPYTLTIIDTPGFGDTSGISRDKDIIKQMHSFFSTEGIAGIDHIDAVEFVVQSSLPRLTPTQKYIFQSILSIFGNDIKDNIIILATFADSQGKPPVMAAIDAAEVPYKVMLKFNNSALFVNNSCAVEDTDEDDDEDDNGIQGLQWKMATKSYKRFFKELEVIEPKSLLLTKEVLGERSQVEADIAGLQRTFKTTEIKLSQLNKETDLLKEQKDKVEANKNYQYTVQEEKVVKKRVDENVTNCTKCKVTCHYPCLVQFRLLYLCKAMSWYGYCRICPGECSSTKHENTNIKFEHETRTVTKDLIDIKKRYEAALGAKVTTEQMVEEHKQECNHLQFRVLELTESIRKSVNRLREISLTKNPMSSVDYINLQLETEEKENGVSDKYKQLKELKEQVELLESVQRDDCDMLKQYKKQLGKDEKGNIITFKRWIESSRRK